MILSSIIYKSIKTPNTIIQYVFGVALLAAVLLLLPLLAMLITKEVDWSLFDFVAAWILLFSAGFTYRMVARKMNNIMYKAAVGVAVGTSLLLIWSNLAVGLIGSEDNPANWMYVGVLAIGFLGAIITRLQPKGMYRVLFSMAFAHALIAVIALIARLDMSAESSAIEILGVNGFFVVLWIGSALLFRSVKEAQMPVNSILE
ncbi:MAG: hypothetical protein ACYC4T_03590 [Melioribacteraceae bacterium]